MPKTRRAVLAELFRREDKPLHQRELERRTKLHVKGVQRELKALAEAGIVLRERSGNRVYYRANPRCPIYPELKMLILKTVGLADVLREALAPLSDRIQVSFVHGSVARGEEKPGSDVDVLVVGDVSFAEVAGALGSPQETLGREVNPSVYPPDEFRHKLAGGHHFLKTVLTGEKLFLIGGENELERLGK